MRNYKKTSILKKKSKADIVGFFDSVASRRNSLFLNNKIVGYEQQVRSKSVLEMLDVKPLDFVLDLGCGNGRDLIELSNQNFDNFLGIDISPEMISEAKKELVLRKIDAKKVQVGSATNLYFPDNTFDKIIASEVIEHIPDYGKAITEMRRVLKNNGYLIITTPNRNSWYGIDNFVYRLVLKVFNRENKHPYDEWKNFSELKKLLESTGFKILEVRGACYIPGFLFTYRAPDAVKKIIIFCVSKIELKMSKFLPKNGYMLCVKAKKI